MRDKFGTEIREGDTVVNHLPHMPNAPFNGLVLRVGTITPYGFRFSVLGRLCDNEIPDSAQKLLDDPKSKYGPTWIVVVPNGIHSIEQIKLFFAMLPTK